jgi:tripartite-type tricarboxylate transporter receptor subunit TctC
MKNLPVDPVKDFTPIMAAVEPVTALVVNADLPVNSVQELIAYAKANPGKLSYGSPGIGTPQHVAGELLGRLAGIKMEHIPYRGANLTDTMSGIVPVGIQNAGAAMPFVHDGRVRGLAVTSLKRSPNAPDLPTVAELGFPGFEATSWFALLAPKGTPTPILERLHKETEAALNDPQVKQAFEKAGAETMLVPLDQAKKWQRDEVAKYTDIIAKAGIPKIE